MEWIQALEISVGGRLVNNIRYTHTSRLAHHTYIGRFISFAITEVTQDHKPVNCLCGAVMNLTNLFHMSAHHALGPDGDCVVHAVASSSDTELIFSIM
jgi:hypothetical protein